MKSVTLHKTENPKTYFSNCHIPKSLTDTLDLEDCYQVGGASVFDKEKLTRYLDAAYAQDLERMAVLTELPTFPCLYGLLCKIKNAPHKYRLFVLYLEDGLYGDQGEYVTDIDELEVIPIESEWESETRINRWRGTYQSILKNKKTGQEIEML